jgi:uracil-DNA glycosylase
MSETLNIDEIKEKFYNKLQDSGWARVLRGFIFSTEFEKIIRFLHKESIEGKRFTPKLKDLFKAFELCPYNDLKVVIIGQDPYPGVNIADGIAFSCSYTREAQPSIRFMLDEVNATVYNGYNVSTDPDLSRWSKQGVLLLNVALTTTVSKIGQHYLIWQPFIAYVLDTLTWNNPGLVYIYMGKKASEWKDAVNDTNYKFEVSHPNSALYNNQSKWDSQGVFVKTKEILKANNNFEIEW